MCNANSHHLNFPPKTPKEHSTKDNISSYKIIASFLKTITLILK